MRDQMNAEKAVREKRQVTNQLEPAMLNVEQAQRYAGVGRNTVLFWIHSGQIAAFKADRSVLGAPGVGKWIILREDLLRFLQEQARKNLR
ncbi:MAG: helix-turn-helix domain-containing protein [Methanosarcinales archaeon]|nr:helix-turn-helix domain-containing protein [Methanosarcinales archaeon]